MPSWRCDLSYSTSFSIKTASSNTPPKSISVFYLWFSILQGYWNVCDVQHPKHSFPAPNDGREETQKCLFALKLLLKWIALRTCRHATSNKDVENILKKNISTARGRSIFEWQTLMGGVLHEAVTQMCSYSQSFPCHLSCKSRKQSCSACYTLHTP